MFDKGKIEGVNRKKICLSFYVYKDGEIYFCLLLVMRFVEIGV